MLSGANGSVDSDKKKREAEEMLEFLKKHITAEKQTETAEANKANTIVPHQDVNSHTSTGGVQPASAYLKTNLFPPATNEVLTPSPSSGQVVAQQHEPRKARL